MAETSKSNLINSKKLIIDYIDWLVNRVDIYTEEMLKQFTKTDILKIKKQMQINQEARDPFHHSIYDNPYSENLNFEINLTSQYDESEPILVWDYLNSTRDEMIKKLHEAQAEAFKRIENLKNDLGLINGSFENDVEKTSQVFGKLFSRRFPILIDIRRKSNKNLVPYANDQPFSFNLYLIELDFFINDKETDILR